MQLECVGQWNLLQLNLPNSHSSAHGHPSRRRSLPGEDLVADAIARTDGLDRECHLLSRHQCNRLLYNEIRNMVYQSFLRFVFIHLLYASAYNFQKTFDPLWVCLFLIFRVTLLLFNYVFWILRCFNLNLNFFYFFLKDRQFNKYQLEDDRFKISTKMTIW